MWTKLGGTTCISTVPLDRCQPQEEPRLRPRPDRGAFAGCGECDRHLAETAPALGLRAAQVPGGYVEGKRATTERLTRVTPS